MPRGTVRRWRRHGMNRWVLIAALAAVGALTAVPAAVAATLADVEQSFYPYRDGTPELSGLAAGSVITAANVDSVPEGIEETLRDLIRQGLVEIGVGETLSFDLHPAYVEATRRHLNEVSLGDQPGVILNYVAGRPFPEQPDTADPRAGEKLAWNFRYNYSGDSGVLTHFIWKYKDMAKGKLERTLRMQANLLNFKHRLIASPLPDLPNNPSGIYQGLYLRVQEPPDLRNTQLLVHRMEDNRERERTWLYLNTHRRVRRLGAAQTTDAFLGSDIMIEDFLGYNGRLMDMEWSYGGTVNTLLAYFNHDEMDLDNDEVQRDGWKFTGFHGKGRCFPNVTWQVRKAYILEARPTDPRHPISRRVFYVDAQTATMSYTRIYDRAGKLWKVAIGGFSHPDHHHPRNRGTGVNTIDLATMIDLQARHCTTLQFKALVGDDESPVGKFAVQYMRVQGR